MESNKQVLYPTLLKKIRWIIETRHPRDEKLKAICELLKSAVSTYDWVGFYLVDPKKDRELVLGPYAGEPTVHTRIKFGQGICGQAAESLRTVVIDDVTAESNYLSCSIHVKSEIVVPIFKRGRLVGELDLDSHQTAAFSSEDKQFLQQVADKTSSLF